MRGTVWYTEPVSEPAASLPDERRRLIAEQLKERGSVSVSQLGERFGISLMTARRDLAALERHGVARRTHGGAVLPVPTNAEDSFGQRLDVSTEAKERLGVAAAAFVSPGEAVFVDSSTTGWYAARRLVRDNVRCTLEAEVKREMILHARTPLLLVDGSKFERPALNAIGPVTDVARVLAADVPPAALAALTRMGVAVDRV